MFVKVGKESLRVDKFLVDGHPCIANGGDGLQGIVALLALLLHLLTYDVQLLLHVSLLLLVYTLQCVLGPFAQFALRALFLGERVVRRGGLHADLVVKFQYGVAHELAQLGLAAQQFLAVL